MYKVDNDKCLRCGMCTGICPDVFSFDDEGNIKVNNEIINESNINEVTEAKDSCPVSAINIEKEEENKA